jgi:hypothetical protein
MYKDRPYPWKIRSGKFLAKVRWIYKEKEIKKLLARLRDLKLSLMSTLSFMNVLKADLIIDSLGLSGPSLLQRSLNQPLSKETTDRVTETEHTLAALSMLSTVRDCEAVIGGQVINYQAIGPEIYDQVQTNAQKAQGTVNILNQVSESVCA